MSKTLEAFRKHDEDDELYEVNVPDHKKNYHVNGYSIDTARELYTEDGRTYIDIPKDEFFHVDEQYGGTFIEITVSNEPQEDEQLFDESVVVNRDITDVTFEKEVVQRAEKRVRDELLEDGTINPTDGTVRAKMREKLEDWAMERTLSDQGHNDLHRDVSVELDFDN